MQLSVHNKLRIIRFLKQTIVLKSSNDKPWFDYRCALAHRANQRAYRMWSHSRSQTVWSSIVARRRAQLVFGYAERAFTERSK